MNKMMRGLRKVGKFLDKHSPAILVGCGIAGFISTTIIVAKKTPEAKEALDELHEELAEKDEELSKGRIIFEEVKTVAPIYAPAVVTGVVSVGCILGSYKISTSRTAALATAYEITQASYSEYKSKVRENIGEKKEKEIRDAIATEKVSHNPPPETSETEVIMTDGKSLFYDSYGGRYFRSSIDIVRKAERDISDQLAIEDWVPLNEFYYLVGLPDTKLGQDVGFSKGNNPHDVGIDVVFNSILAPNNEPCTVIEFGETPIPDLTWRY